VIDAIRSGADVEVSFDEQVIRTPKYNITRLQDKCETCGKIAKQASERTVVMPDDMPDIKYIELECGHMIVRKIPKGTPFHKFQTGGSPTCQHEWNKNACTKCGRFRPYDFQLEGMKFLETALSVSKGGAVFDEMGLGKTIQAGGYLYFHPEVWPVLWIVKSGLKYQTSSFIINWMNSDNPDEAEHIPQIVNSSKDWLIPGLKHYIIGYDMLVPKTKMMKKSGKTISSGFDIAQFDRIGIKTVVLDECQQIKNVDSTRTQMVRRVVKSRKVIPLSGTPWNNRGSELFPVFNMMDPIKFNSEEGFKRTWVQTYWQGQFLKEGGIRKYAYVNGSRTEFKEYTKDICIRRERIEVLKELPLVNRTKLNVVMDPKEEQLYDEAVDQFVQWFEAQKDGIGGMAIIAAMAKMRHLVALAKIPTTLEYVDEFIEDTDRKLVVFAHHQDVQDILFQELKEKYSGEIPVLKIVADMNAYKRNEAADQFNSAPRAILVGSQLAMGEGLNLQTCSDCVMHERQWNPGKEEQCEGRFIRIGQTAESVNSVYAHMEGLTAIDAQLDAIVSRKRIQFHDWTGTEAAKWSEDSLMKELAVSIVNAHNAKRGRKSA
jgi:SNF2 family DNA or RNA helicase